MVTEGFAWLLQWVAANPTLSGVMIFLVAFSESMAVIGLLVPGVVMMFGIGALVAAGSIELATAIGWAVAGAIAGDGLSFWLGRHFSDRVETIWPFSRHPGSLQRGIGFFEKYGGKSVFIGRFFGPVRAIIPLVAGMMGMPPGRFVLANILSALVWAPAYLLPGMLVGASLELASQVALRLVLLLLLLLALLWAGYRLTQVLVRLLQPVGGQMLGWLLGLSRRDSWLGELAASLADPNHPEARGLSLLALLLLAGIALFGLVTGHALQGYQGPDSWVLQALQSLRTPWGDQLVAWFTLLGDYRVMLVVTAGVLGYLALAGHRRSLYYWLGATAFAFVAGAALKLLLQLPRPEVVLAPPHSYSFPSGHTLKATVIYGFLAVMLARPLAPSRRWMPYAAAVVPVTLVGFSRLYLGVHWLSDVLASLALGLVWVSFLGIAYGRHTQVERHWGRLAFCSLLLIIIGLGWQSNQVPQMVQRYQPLQPVSRTLEPELWWARGESSLENQRQSLTRGGGSRFNLQYLGDLESLRQTLLAKGWKPSAALDWSALLRLVSPEGEIAELPLFPQVHAARHEALALNRVENGNRLVLRLWPARIQPAEGGETLWLGSVSEQAIDRSLGLIRFASTLESQDHALERLRNDLVSSGWRLRDAQGALRIRPSDAPGSD